MKINIAEIRIDGGTQSRVEINQQVVEDYAEAIKAGIRFPEISLFFDGAIYWLVDGFHRFHAHRIAGKKSIDAESRSGTQREAVLYSVGANSDHGLRRSNADKRKAVGILLADAEWSKWSDNAIAEQCNVSNHLVGEMRRAILENSKIEPVRKVERNGKIYEQNTANIGKKSDAQDSSGAGSSAKAQESCAPDPKKPLWPIPGQKGALADVPDDMPSDVEIMEGLEKTIREQAAMIEAYEADDKQAELVKQTKLASHYRREIGFEQDKNAKLMKERDDLQRWQNRVRDATGCDTPTKALAAVRDAFKRAA